ncbi:recombinase [Pasteurellaceae bacterium LFhippo2]|nr:recombinase [Pasteurellaceae bacterium LFhippo2]
MNLDKFCLITIICLLPILILPQQGLWLGIGMACFILCWGIFRVNFWFLLLSAMLFLNYGQIIAIAKKSDEFTACKKTEMVNIVQILKQQDYQTAIAVRENGDRVYLNWQSSVELEFGKAYQAELNLRPISSRLNIGNFDRQRWYFAQNIRGIATVKKAKLIEEPQGKNLRINWLYHAKQQIKDLDSQGLLLALAFGERAWLKAEDWQIFQQTATAHLIAISGLHIGLAMLFGFWLAKGMQWIIFQVGIGRQLALSYLFPRIIGFFIALAYSFLAGFAIPTVRALVAISLVLICQYSRRHYTAWQLWLRVVTLLIVIDPLTLLSDSFWLSILAVASLIFWYQHFPAKLFWLYERVQKQSIIFRIFYSLIHLQLGIWLVFSPIQLFFFSGLSIFGFIANLLIVPLYSFVLVPVILITLITDNLFHTWQVADWLGSLSLNILQPMSDSWLDLSYQQQWLLLSVNLLILLAIYGYIWHKGKCYWLLMMIVPLIFNQLYKLPQWLIPQPIIQWIHFDVGQGLATAFVYKDTTGRKRAIFYDTGASWQNKQSGQTGSMAKLEIIPYLKREGIYIETIVVSHDDNDHSGGVNDLLNEYPSATLILSSKNHYSANDFSECIKGNQWRFDDLTLRAIYPTQVVERAKNEDSCVLIAEIGQYRILLTGDSGVAQEREFAQNVGKMGFLQVGHHGSKTSTSHTLLANIQPDIAIISAGRWNPWKMPNHSVLERLTQYNTQIFNTAISGMIIVNFYQNEYQIKLTRGKYNAWYQSYFGQ